MSDGLKLIASILENGSTMTFRMLEEQFFVDEEEIKAYEFSKGHFRRYGELPEVDTVEDETQIRFPDTPETVDYYLQNVHKRHVYNEVRAKFRPLRDAISASNIDDIRQEAQAIYQSCVPYSSGTKELLTLSELSGEVLKKYEYAHGLPGMVGVATGFNYLDEETYGYQNGDLIVWPGRPGIGKTHLLLKAAKAAYDEGKSILFVSMEMTLAQLASRIACHKADLDPMLVRKGKLSYWGRKMLKEAVGYYTTAHNFHLFAGNFNKRVEDVDMLVQELGPDIIYIDGMYLMNPSGGRKGMGRYESSAYVTDELKRITLMRDRPIVATTQFGRAAGKGGEEGSLENIGYTDTIGTHASIVVGIKGGRRVVKNIKRERGGVVEVINTIDTYPFRHIEIMKNRDGALGEFGINFSFAPTNFEEVSLEEATGTRQTPAKPDMRHMK
ncbi:MAG: hypothetical protein BMS9Abin11_1728 [Gammaproteobacteria bacterium]|nr:MAG: hypothetical protein BMS9Abin11_1728 [Gammaproteobacteria bacterium]